MCVGLDCVVCVVWMDRVRTYEVWCSLVQYSVLQCMWCCTHVVLTHVLPLFGGSLHEKRRHCDWSGCISCSNPLMHAVARAMGYYESGTLARGLCLNYERCAWICDAFYVLRIAACSCKRDGVLLEAAP
jgi:hypothetical protein